MTWPLAPRVSGHLFAGALIAGALLNRRSRPRGRTGPAWWTAATRRRTMVP